MKGTARDERDLGEALPVVVVDDDEGARDSVKALVRSMGLQAETFSSAEAFLDDLDPSRPGCLVTDVRMMGSPSVTLTACPKPAYLSTGKP